MSEPVIDSACSNRKRCSSNANVNCKRVCPEQTYSNSLVSTAVAADCDSNNTCLSSYSLVVHHASSEHVHINNLPVLNMLKIFNYLSLGDRQHRVALVCQYWLKLSRDPYLWKYVVLRNQRKVTDFVLKSISEYSSALTVLDITDCICVTDCGLSVILKACSRLAKLRLTRLKNFFEIMFLMINFAVSVCGLCEFARCFQFNSLGCLSSGFFRFTDALSCRKLYRFSLSNVES